MGKRTRLDTDYEYIAKKVYKLNKKLKRARRKERSKDRRRTSSSSSDSSLSSSSARSSSASPQPRSCAQPSVTLRDASYIQDAPSDLNAGAIRAPPTIADGGSLPSTSAVRGPLPCTSAGDQLGPSTSAATNVPPPSRSSAGTPVTGNVTIDIQPSTSATDCSTGTQLNDDVLQILGDDPSQQKIFGKDIQPDLAVRLQHIATSGLAKEARKALLDKYLPPANCSLINAPALNLEVKAAIPEAIYKRHKAIEQKQRQVSSVISCLAETLTNLMPDAKNASLIQMVMDACKLLCDSQYTDSVTRRNFVFHNIKKELKDQLHATSIDKLLFSENLSDTLKAAKAIAKSSADMKLSVTRNQNKKPSKPSKNWRAPPPHQGRTKGNYRSQVPAYRNYRENLSKQSSHPAPGRGRRR